MSIFNDDRRFSTGEDYWEWKRERDWELRMEAAYAKRLDWEPEDPDDEEEED